MAIRVSIGRWPTGRAATKRAVGLAGWIRPSARAFCRFSGCRACDTSVLANGGLGAGVGPVSAMPVETGVVMKGGVGAGTVVHGRCHHALGRQPPPQLVPVALRYPHQVLRLDALTRQKGQPVQRHALAHQARALRVESRVGGRQCLQVERHQHAVDQPAVHPVKEGMQGGHHPGRAQRVGQRHEEAALPQSPQIRHGRDRHEPVVLCRPGCRLHAHLDPALGGELAGLRRGFLCLHMAGGVVGQGPVVAGIELGGVESRQDQCLPLFGAQLVLTGPVGSPVDGGRIGGRRRVVWTVLPRIGGLGNRLRRQGFGADELQTGRFRRALGVSTAGGQRRILPGTGFLGRVAHGQVAQPQCLSLLGAQFLLAGPVGLPVRGGCIGGPDRRQVAVIGQA